MPTTKAAYARQGDGIRAHQIDVQVLVTTRREGCDAMRESKNALKGKVIGSAKTRKERENAATVLDNGRSLKESFKNRVRDLEYGTHLLREDEGYDTGKANAPKVYRGRVNAWEHRVRREEGGTYWNV